MTPEQLADECEQFDTSLDRDAAHANAAMTALLQDASAELRRLAAENAALRKDAERYRWLRNHNPTRYAIDLGANIIDINCKEDGQYELDAAIDKPMKETP